MNYDDLLPGDEILITTPLTVSGINAYGDIETEEGLAIAGLDYEIHDQARPDYWPPQDGDVWNFDHYTGAFYHYLGGGWYDNDGNSDKLPEILSDCDVQVADITLSFRSGVDLKK
jgi:hypothetical protein